MYLLSQIAKIRRIWVDPPACRQAKITDPNGIIYFVKSSLADGRKVSGVKTRMP